MKDIQEHIDGFSPISLGEMDAIELLNRQDTKYFFHDKKLEAILKDLQEHYRILEMDGERVFTYRNTYFDTEDFLFYNSHQRGKLNRTKIRIREYKESGIRFAEIKRKTNKNRTVKTRLKMQASEDIYSKRIREFINQFSPVQVKELGQELKINFTRITLAHKNMEDRCTIDLNLHAVWNGKSYHFENLVIAELKQNRFKNGSNFNVTLKKHKVYPKSISKYCFSFIKLNPSLKQNTFKPKLYQLDKILS